MKTPKRTSIGLGPFLTIDSNTRDVDWREQERLDREEAVMIEFRNAFQIAEKESTALKDSLQVYKARGQLPTSLVGSRVLTNDSRRA